MYECISYHVCVGVYINVRCSMSTLFLLLSHVDVHAARRRDPWLCVQPAAVKEGVAGLCDFWYHADCIYVYHIYICISVSVSNGKQSKGTWRRFVTTCIVCITYICTVYICIHVFIYVHNRQLWRGTWRQYITMCTMYTCIHLCAQQAAVKGDVAAIHHYLYQHPDRLGEKDGFGYGALHSAIEHSQVRMNYGVSLNEIRHPSE